MNSQRTNVFGVMHLGSETISLHIMEYSSLDDLRVVEKTNSQVTLGEEMFKTGTISFSTVKKICDLLKGYRRILSEYGVKDYRLLATTAIREAENQQYIIDQIKVKTGFSVEVVDVPQEIFYKYIALFRSVQRHGLSNGEAGILFVDISSGALGVTLYEGGQLYYQQNIHIGALRIKESFDKSQRESTCFYQALSEYINSSVDLLGDELSAHPMKYLVVSGVETDLVLKMLGRNESAKLIFVPIGEFLELHKRVSVLNLPQLMQEYGLSEQRAEVVLPTILLYHQIMSISNATDLVISSAQFSDGVMLAHAGHKVSDQWLNIIEEQAVSLARAIGRKYKYDPIHASVVEKVSLQLFDKLRKIHGLDRRDRFLLQVAAILHDIGKFVSLRNHYFYSYRLIISSDIFGFSEVERALIANVAYYHSKGVPSNTDDHFNRLRPGQKITVSKLAAILRLADALDRSHLQKVTIENISLAGEEFILTVSSVQDLSLEEWTFSDKAEFFENVFGIRAIIKRQAG